MRIKIAQFLKEFGVRDIGKLQSPRLHSQKKLFLPFESIYHFQTDSMAIRGPNPGDPLFTRLTGKTFIEHVTEMVSFEGNPRVTNNKAPLMINEFRRQNRFFKPLQKDQALTLNAQNTLVLNYNLMPHMWRYQDTFKANWFRWNNERRTFWANVVGAHRRFGYNQFIEIHVPETMLLYKDYNLLQNSAGGVVHEPKPGMEDFDPRVISVEGFQDLLATFNRDGHLDLFDIFQWLGPKRNQSLMGQVPPEAYSKLNFLIRAYDTFLVINVGQLDLWRANANAGEELMVNADGTPRDLKVNPLTPEEKQVIAEQRKGIDGTQLQRRFLSLMAALVEYSQGNVTLTDVDEEVAKADQVEATPAPVDEEDEESGDAVVDTRDTTVKKVEPAFQELELLDLDVFGTTVQPPDKELMPTRITVDGSDDAVVETVSDGGDAIKTLKVQQEPDLVREAPEQIRTVVADAHEMLRLGLISPGSFEKAVEDALSYTRLPNPFTGEGSLEEAMTYQPGDLDVPKPEEYAFRDSPTVFDKSMLTSKLKAMQQKAVGVLLPKQILQCVIAAQSAGAAIVGYKVEEVEDLSDHYQIHKITVKPVRGKASTLLMKIPVIDEDGRYRSRGVIYRQRLQRADKPIRKVAPTKVALTSYINKTFVLRSRLAENNFDEWFTSRIRAKGLNDDDKSVHSILFAELVQDEFHLPRMYSLLGKSFRGFSSNDITFYFQYNDRVKWFKENHNLDATTLEVNGLTLVGVMNGNPVLVDVNSQFYVFVNNDYEPLGTMPEIIGVDILVAPLEAALVSVSNKELPLGMVLGYQTGLSKVLDTLKVSYTRHPRTERLALSGDDYVITFADEKLVFSRSDYKAMLVMAGFRLYKKEIIKFSVYDFDKKDVYYRLLESKSLSARYLRVVDQLFKSWMDPITKTLLEKMGEPTNFEGLLYRSAELLTTDWSPSEVDGAYMRYRGYERLAGTMYSELTKAIQRFHTRNAEATVSLDPHEVWRRIQQDSAKTTIEDHNPIAQIREQEACTYRGDGGRTSQSMVARTRVFTKADIGTLSESTVDSGDVGVVAYLTPDANFEDMFYNSRPFDPTTEPPSKVLSTCSVLGVATSHDDSKRVGFISIQQQQGIHCVGAQVTPLRSGGEAMIAQRVTKLFAGTAKKDGKVISVNDDGIIVEYVDGKKEGFPLGIQHGSAAGKNIPQPLVSDMVVGETFQKGDTVSYNTNYFAKDRLSPRQVLYKGAAMVTVAFSDNLDTLEDGASISEEVARQLMTTTTKVKDIVVRFDQNVQDPVQVGDKVDLETILCAIEDPEVDNGGLFDQSTQDMLRRMAAFSPLAGVVGQVSKIEVFYHGEIEDMSPSLAKLAQASDLRRKQQAEATGAKAYTGSVTEDFRSGGNGLLYENMVIRYYIDHDVPAATGDKAVLCNQMKTVFSRVLTGTNTFADGRPIGIIFGNTSVENRMVLSAKIIACYSILQLIAGKHVANVYRGTANAKAK